eukprot:1257864-Karenia_brevis.AAC.1
MKQGEMRVNWETNNGVRKSIRIKAGSVGKTLISVDKLCEGGYEARLTKTRPKLIHEKTGETIPLRRVKGMFILDMWVKIGPKKSPAMRDDQKMDVGAVSLPVFVRPGW